MKVSNQTIPSDGCKGDAVPLPVDQWYDFHEFGFHLGNVGLQCRFTMSVYNVGLHGCAMTTEAIRRAIQDSQESLIALAKRYGIDPKTVAKWKKRGSVADLRQSGVAGSIVGCLPNIHSGLLSSFGLTVISKNS